MNTFAQALEEKRQGQGLNPALWAGEHLKAEVRNRLLVIAHSFLEDLKTHPIEPKDITVTGSNANFNWNSSSDLDLHIIADLGAIDCERTLANDYFREHSFAWNEHHNITLNGVPVEIYVQDTKEPHYTSGVYSIQNKKWVKHPKHVEYPPNADVAIKAKPLVKKIDSLIKQVDSAHPLHMNQQIAALRERIRLMRKSALAKGGETALENLVFKYLRNNGYLERLLKVGRATYDRAMSLGESQLASQISMSIQEIGTWE